MANSNESNLLTSFQDMTNDMHEVIDQNSKGKEKMFESFESTALLEAHESSPSLEVEPDNGDKHGEQEIDANKNKVPELGQVFASEEEAREYYSTYARNEGFKIRKDRVERKRNGKLYVRHFACTKAGYRQFDRRRVHVKKRRAETKTGCLARLVIRLIDDDTWVVKEFIDDHNHPKATSSPTRVAKVIDCENVGVSQPDGVELVAKEAQGKENPNITELDHQNVLPAMKTMKKNQVGKGEAQRVMDYLKRIQLENPSFFYAVQVNSVQEMINFFWTDARSIMDYGYFGDAVCFDTTYRTNKHSWPLTPFIGVNHHRQTILFGAALLLEENADSFVWLFKTFLEAMSGRKPKTILTDQCATMAKAINIVMPETHHRLCLWHIFQNATIYLPYISKDPSFSIDFKKCIYNDDTEEAFLFEWNQMLEKYGLLRDKWLEGLFEFREKWALVYWRNTFCADLTTSQRGESISCMLKKFLERKLGLPEVVLCYEKVLASRRAKELKADFDSSRTSPALYINAPMLKQVANEYTQEVFEMFQKEFQKFVLYNVEHHGIYGTIREYKVTKIEGGEECLVTLDASNNKVLCSCKKFDFVGIQCKHAMKVLNYNNIHVLPSQYILKRWTKDARVGVVNDSVGNSVHAKLNTSIELRYASICRMAVNIATRGAVSEEAHLVAISGLEKVLEDVEAVMKETQMAASYSICRMNNGGSPIDFILTLAQENERGRPTNPGMSNCVIREQVRERVRKKTNLHDDNGSNSDQPKQKKGREGKFVSFEERDNVPLVNLSCPTEVPTQFSQITKDSDSTHSYKEPYHKSGLHQHSFLPYYGVLPVSFPGPTSVVSVPFIATFGETSTAHVEPIPLTNDLEGQLPPPSVG